MPDRWTVSKVGRIVSQEVELGSSSASTPEILGSAFVPSTDPSSPKAAVEVPSYRSEQRVLEALNGQVETVRRPFLYSVATFVVAVAMVILPLIYLALIALVSYGVFYHATENASLLTSGGSQAEAHALPGSPGLRDCGGSLHDQTPLCPIFSRTHPVLCRPTAGASPLQLCRAAEPARGSAPTQAYRS